MFHMEHCIICSRDLDSDKGRQTMIGCFRNVDLEKGGKN